jgi:hypothetical protein
MIGEREFGKKIGCFLGTEKLGGRWDNAARVLACRREDGLQCAGGDAMHEIVDFGFGCPMIEGSLHAVHLEELMCVGRCVS